MRLTCLGGALSLDTLLGRGSAFCHHDFSTPGPHPGHPVAFPVTFVLQVHLWHLGVSPAGSRPGADSISHRGFNGHLTTITMPLRGQVFAVPSCPSAIASDPLTFGLA